MSRYRFVYRGLAARCWRRRGLWLRFHRGRTFPGSLRLDNRGRDVDGADAGRHRRVSRIWRRNSGSGRIVIAAALGVLVGGFARHFRLRGVCAGCGIENRGEALLELVLIGRRDEGAAGHSRHTSERLEARLLVVEPDHMDAQALGLLFQRGGGCADIGVAAIATVGDQHDFELRVCRLRVFGGVAQGCCDRSRALRLDRAEHFRLRLRGEHSGLRQQLAVGAVRGLAVAEGDEAERQPVAVSADGLAELGADGRDLARAPDLLVHAARGIEHDDGRGESGIGDRGWRVLGESGRPRSKKSGGQERKPKPRAAFPPHGVCSDSLAARCYTFFRHAYSREIPLGMRPIWGGLAESDAAAKR